MTVFEIIIARQQVLNDNILQLSQNIQQIYTMLENLLNAKDEPLQPTASGDEGIPEIGSQTNTK